MSKNERSDSAIDESVSKRNARVSKEIFSPELLDQPLKGYAKPECSAQAKVHAATQV